MKPVQERPPLPQASPVTFGGLVQFTGSLTKQLISLLQEYGYRLNRVLPKDGTEPMTGNLDMDGHNILNAADNTFTGLNTIYSQLTTTVSIADDAVAVFDFGNTNARGRAILVPSATADIAAFPHADVAFRASNGNAPLIVSIVNATDVSTTTGALTGTTGVDGDVTFSTDDGKFYIENRRGKTLTITVSFVACSHSLVSIS